MKIVRFDKLNDELLLFDYLLLSVKRRVGYSLWVSVACSIAINFDCKHFYGISWHILNYGGNIAVKSNKCLE
jgi:hypothetical protein